MTSRVKEVIDFASMEPLAIVDITTMLRNCDHEEIDEIEHVGQSLISAIQNLGTPESEFHEILD